MFIYFLNGLQHFFVGLVLAFAYFKIQRKRIPSDPGFWIGITITSSALFFLPTHLHFLGGQLDFIYQFLHYPVSDWDLLVLGGQWHRSFITHSITIGLPAFVGGRWQPPVFALGFILGLSSHLLWDGVSGSMMTKVVFIPGWLFISGLAAKAWLILNGLLLLPLLGRQR